MFKLAAKENSINMGYFLTSLMRHHKSLYKIMENCHELALAPNRAMGLKSWGASEFAHKAVTMTSAPLIG